METHASKVHYSRWNCTGGFHEKESAPNVCIVAKLSWLGVTINSLMCWYKWTYVGAGSGYRVLSKKHSSKDQP